MNYKIPFFTLIMTALGAFSIASCSTPAASENSDSAAISAEGTMVDDSAATATDAEDATDTATDAMNEEPTEATQSPRKKVSEPAYGGKETLYISTYGANGKVWGHVTMNGKTGRGTIHDEDENSYSITVTRHGGELYGTDQNGRQYVFRM